MKRYAVAFVATASLTVAGLMAPAPEGRSQHWPTVRRHYLAAHPKCEVCGREAEEVHHCLPFHVDSSLELDPSNLIGLCRHDHFLIGHGQSWKCWNTTIREDAAEIRKIIERIKRERAGP